MTDTAVAGTVDVADAIRAEILGGGFAPDQRLIEADLSERYGASRASVRTALLTLASEGLVERLPNRGARVRSITVDEAVEIAEVRVGLEVLVARRAAELLDEAQAARLEALRTGIQDAVAGGDLVGYSELNQQLDRDLREISRHGTATAVLERLRAQAARHQFRLAFHPGRAAEGAVEHVAIIDAVLARDPDAAEAATRSHLEGIVALLRRMA